MPDTYYVYSINYPDNDVPFYIGKGKGNRVNVSLNEQNNSYKCNTIKSIRNLGKEPTITIMDSDLSEIDALKYEMELIERFGRKLFEGGVLTNISRGGFGGNPGWCPSDETKRIWSEQRLGVKQSPDHIEVRRKQLIGKKRNDTNRANIIRSKLDTELCAKVYELNDAGATRKQIAETLSVDLGRLQRLISKRGLYEIILAGEQPDDKFDNYVVKEKYPPQQVTHILKHKAFYVELFEILDNNSSIPEAEKKLNTNRTRIRSAIKNRTTIEDIIMKERNYAK